MKRMSKRTPMKQHSVGAACELPSGSRCDSKRIPWIHVENPSYCITGGRGLNITVLQCTWSRIQTISCSSVWNWIRMASWKHLFTPLDCCTDDEGETILVHIQRKWLLLCHYGNQQQSMVPNTRCMCWWPKGPCSWMHTLLGVQIYRTHPVHRKALELQRAQGVLYGKC